jgi:microsomal dipeptidase-like Zn-dependent dipeptidase
MSLKTVTLYVVLLLTAVAGACSQQTQPADPLVAKALAIHERALTLDTHVDIGGATYATPALDPGAPTSRLKCDLTKMEKGGLDGVFLAVFVGQGPLDEAGYKKAWEQSIEKFDALQRLTKQMYPNRSAFATSPDEVERIAKTGKRVIMTGVENGYPIGTDIANVKKLYDLGARYITLCHGGNNQLADSSGGKEPLNNGLSELGKQVVVEMNRLGIMIDISHIAEKSFWDVIAITKAPIIASHSGCKAINDVNRNLTDEQLKALTKNGGVIQMVALGGFLKTDVPARRDAIAKAREELGLPAGRGADPATMTEEQRAEQKKKTEQLQERMKEIDAKYPPAMLKDFIDHLDHAVKVAGIDHVGVGTDFDGGGGVPGLNDDTDLPNVTIELVRRGYTEEQIKKIWGENLLRVWREVEKVAASTPKA